MRIIYYIFYFLLLSACYCCCALLLSFALSFLYPMWTYSLFPCAAMLVVLVFVDPIVSWLIAEKIVKWTDLENRIL